MTSTNQWEYRVVEWNDKKKPLAILLAGAGDDGWELVQVVDATLIFKRPKPPERRPILPVGPNTAS